MNTAEKLEPVPTYEEWYESQCNYGFDLDEDFLIDSIEHYCKSIGKSNGLGEGTIDPQLYKRDATGYKPMRQTLAYEIGGYNDFLVFESIIDYKSVPEDSKLRLEFPLAFDALKHDFIYDTWCDMAGRNVKYYEMRWEKTDGDYLDEYDDNHKPIAEGSIYDGMPSDVYLQLADEQMDGLAEYVKAVIEEITDAALSGLRADYEYFFSEERYKEELELN